ncbi:hypothetical protein J2S53_002071 [Actinopolyspora lacussalsi]|nr:hypothetical protein [Actinopolyspora lacussalsi]
MSNPHTHLAGLLTQGHWLLERAAYEIGGNRYSPTQCNDTADALEQLAAALHEHAATLPRGELTAGTEHPAEADGPDPNSGDDGERGNDRNDGDHGNEDD